MDLKWYWYLRGSWEPSFRSIRIAVGAVWKMFTFRRSAIRHGRPASGNVGTPSYSTLVAAFARGPLPHQHIVDVLPQLFRRPHRDVGVRLVIDERAVAPVAVHRNQHTAARILNA